MKAILSTLVVVGIVYGMWYYQTGEDPIDSLIEKSPTKHIDTAQKAADSYNSAFDERYEAEFGEGI